MRRFALARAVAFALGCALSAAPLVLTAGNAAAAQKQVRGVPGDWMQTSPLAAMQTATSVWTPWIVGGDAADVANYPWIVSLQVSGSHFCGGSLVAPQWVLTAAHCAELFSQLPDSMSITAHMGSSRLSSMRRHGIAVVDAILHEDYSRWTIDSDIAVLKLAETVDDVTPVPLLGADDAGSDMDAPDTTSVVVGWGKTDAWDDNSIPNRLQEAYMPLTDSTVCNDFYSRGYWDEAVTANMICAGGPDLGRDACNGDSGGPLLVWDANGDMVQVGVVSWGTQSCDSYGVFSRVSRFESWVRDLVGPAVLDGAGEEEAEEEVVDEDADSRDWWSWWIR